MAAGDHLLRFASYRGQSGLDAAGVLYLDVVC